MCRDLKKGVFAILNYRKLLALGIVILLAAIASSFARDLAYQVHAVLFMLIASGLSIWTLRQTDEPVVVVGSNGYMGGVVRAGVIATGFWGCVGFLVGVFIAFKLAFPSLNVEWAQPYANFDGLLLSYE
jgi:cytochrome c oxidase cbb3-type subunit 1